MNPNIFHVVMYVFGTLITVIGVLILLNYKDIKSDIDKLEKKQNDFIKEVTKDYATKIEVQKNTDDIFEAIKEIRNDIKILLKNRRIEDEK